ncbi:MAG: polysaccharide deacetylase family protein [Clostridia bacterium]
MFQGKMKALTFSYDDGITQDIRLIHLLDKYALKATFNLNSALLGTSGTLSRQGICVSHDKIAPGDVARIYHGHEVAVHTLTHPLLPELTDAQILREVDVDRQTLSRLTGQTVVGMAYPGGGVNFTAHVATLIATHTPLLYARTTVCSLNFELQSDLMQYHPTLHHMQWDELFSLGQSFVSLHPNRPQLFYIWGHAYEFDIENTWTRFESFCQMISGKDDIAYLTNRDALLGDII